MVGIYPKQLGRKIVAENHPEMEWVTDITTTAIPHLQFQRAEIIDTAGSLSFKTRPRHNIVVSASSLRLFMTSSTIPPSGRLKAIARIPSWDPDVLTRTAPGRTNLLKWAR